MLSVGKTRGNYLRNVIFVFLGILIIFSYAISPYNVELDPDATCYMGVTRLLLDGKIPLIDFKIDYTPLVMYLMCLPVSIFGASYPVGMITTYLVQAYDAFLVYGISRQHKFSKSHAIFAALWFLLCCLFFGGRQYLLEPFVLAFGLSSIFVIRKKSFCYAILSGTFCFCAFWTKQYGLGFLPLLVLAIILERENKRVMLFRICAVVSGFIFTALLFLSILLLSGVDFNSFRTLLHGDYECSGFSGLIESYCSLLTFFPLLVWPVVTLTLNTKAASKDSLTLLSFCGILIFMMQGWVRYNYHYLMLAVPFAIWLLLAVCRQMRTCLAYRMYGCFLAVVLLIPTIVAIRKDYIILTSDRRTTREACAAEVAKLVPVGSENVYTSINMLSLTLQNNYLPPCIKDHGMSNGFLMDPSEAFELLQSADYCVIAKEDLSNEELFPEKLREHLEKEFTSTEISVGNKVYECLVFSKQ